MAANKEPVFVLGAINATANTQIGTTILPADTTDLKDVVSGATDGTLIYDLVASTDETVARDITVYLHDGTTSWPLGVVEVGIGAKSVSLLNITDIPSLDKRDDGGILLATGQKLQVSSDATVTAEKTIWVVALGGNF